MTQRATARIQIYGDKWSEHWVLACKESLEEQLTNYDSLEENEENDKKIENSENVTDTGKSVMNKLIGI